MGEREAENDRQTDRQGEFERGREGEKWRGRGRGREGVGREGSTVLACYKLFSALQSVNNEHRYVSHVLGLFVCWLVACPSNMLVYLTDGSAQTILRAATLRQKLQIKRSTSPSHSILTSGRPVPSLTI